MDTIKIEKQMQDWFLHFDENIEQLKIIHRDEIDLKKYTFKEVKRGVDSNVKKIKQKEGARRG